MIASAASGSSLRKKNNRIGMACRPTIKVPFCAGWGGPRATTSGAKCREKWNVDASLRACPGQNLKNLIFWKCFFIVRIVSTRGIQFSNRIVEYLNAHVRRNGPASPFIVRGISGWTNSRSQTVANGGLSVFGTTAQFSLLILNHLLLNCKKSKLMLSCNVIQMYLNLIFEEKKSQLCTARKDTMMKSETHQKETILLCIIICLLSRPETDFLCVRDLFTAACVRCVLRRVRWRGSQPSPSQPLERSSA